MSKPLNYKNPINLRPFKYPYYIGQSGVAPDGEAIFNTWLDGIRAGIMDLNLKIDSHGYNTLNKLIPVFAPASDGNNTNAYINYVSKQTGFKPDQQLVSDNATIKALFMAMAGEEMGYYGLSNPPFTPNDVDLGIQYYASDEWPMRAETAINEANATIPNFNIYVFMFGAFMFTKKILHK